MSKDWQPMKEERRIARISMHLAENSKKFSEKKLRYISNIKNKKLEEKKTSSNQEFENTKKENIQLKDKNQDLDKKYNRLSKDSEFKKTRKKRVQRKARITDSSTSKMTENL